MILGMMHRRERSEQVGAPSHCVDQIRCLSDLVIATGGKSVAERARLFGTQVAAAQPKPQPVAPKRNFIIPKKQDQQLNKPQDRRLAESPT